ncbi:MAG: EamA family transporter, partial [Candidatus Fonsibacter sp.]
NLIHQKNFKDKIPFIQSIAYGMFYGSVFTLIVAKFRGAELIFDYSFSYISSLLYLAIVGSVVAFYLYLKLLESIGSARAGYIGVIMPIIALIISTIFEDLQWTNNLIFGLPVLILGCVLILNQKSKKI